MKKALTTLALFSVLMLAGMPLLSMAQSGLVPGTGTVPGEPVAGTPTQGVSFVYQVLNAVIIILFYVLMFVAVIYILLAAFNYLTAAGDVEKVEKAQKMLLYAVIAIVIGVLARSVPFIVKFFVGNLTGIS